MIMSESILFVYEITLILFVYETTLIFLCYTSNKKFSHCIAFVILKNTNIATHAISCCHQRFYHKIFLGLNFCIHKIPLIVFCKRYPLQLYLT